MNVKETISNIHESDCEQLNAIFSTDKRIMLVAPAGCGKTKTLVSKISYLLSTNELGRYKKVLALTFSVNAAYKMKKDIHNICPSLTNISYERIEERIYISNYHGFARNVLSKYGFLLDEKFKDINSYIPISDDKVSESEHGLSNTDCNYLKEFSYALNSCNRKFIDDNLDKYYSIVIKLLQKNTITYNGYLVSLLKLLEKKNMLKLYQNIYPYLMIDEYQDTNYLGFLIIKKIVSNTTSLFFMGDDLQKIYGFIGAIDGLIDETIRLFNMSRIELKKNYRFRDNHDMLLLDKNIRLNAEGKITHIENDANINLKLFRHQEDENDYVVKVITNLKSHENDKLAILSQSRDNNLITLLDKLDDLSIDYFYALFTENDLEYNEFHEYCLKIFESSCNATNISSAKMKKTLHEIKEHYLSGNKTIQSLLLLLEVFLKRVDDEYYFLSPEEKHELIRDSFVNRNLKQNMEFVESQICISTIYGAKGLEWEYVFIPNCESYVFPNYPSLCIKCEHKVDSYNCRILKYNKKLYLEELSVFYVAVTRAKKKIAFSASLERLNKDLQIKNSYISCLLNIPGIKHSYN